MPCEGYGTFRRPPAALAVPTSPRTHVATVRGTPAALCRQGALLLLCYSATKPWGLMGHQPQVVSPHLRVAYTPDQGMV